MKFQPIKPLFANYHFQIIARILGVILFLYIVLKTSWTSDDAQITFRTILNFVNGLGITFNYGERVQAFTHPLWFFVLSGAISLTNEIFFTTQIISILISMMANYCVNQYGI